MCSVSRKAIFSLISGLILSFCYTAGFSLDRYDTLDLKDGSVYLKFLFLTVVFAIGSYVLWEGMDRLGGILKRRTGKGRATGEETIGGEATGEETIGGEATGEETIGGEATGEEATEGETTGGATEREAADGKTGGRLRGVCCMAVMVICWLPAFLSLFPGAFSYDALNEWLQVHNGALTSHHPVIHVLVLGWLVEGVHALTGSYNAGIAVYTLLQMLLLAGLLTLSIKRMGELGLSKKIQVFSFLFFCLSPVVQLFSISATKDVIFSAAELLLLIELVLFYLGRAEFFANKRRQAEFVLVAFFTMILRNNGVYIVLGMLFVMFLSCLENRRKMAALMAAVILPYVLYTGPFCKLLGVTPGGVEEMLSVPLQQMARVYHYNQESCEQTDVDLLLSFVPQESLKGYRATVSDFVKKDFRREVYQKNGGEFWKLWVKWGIRHPMTYLNSFLIGTVDFWYPHAVVDGYRHADGRSSYFDYQVDEPGTAVVLLGGVHDYYERISHDPDVQSLPFVFLALSPGWYFLVFVFLFLYLWRNKKYHVLLPQMLLWLHFGTVLLGPMALVRYVLIFYFAFPLLLGSAVETVGKRQGAVPAEGSS